MNNLKKIREAKGMNQEELAFRCNVSRVSISHFESGRHSPKVDIAKRIADVLGVTLDELVGGANAD